MYAVAFLIFFLLFLFCDADKQKGTKKKVNERLFVANNNVMQGNAKVDKKGQLIQKSITKGEKEYMKVSDIIIAKMGECGKMINVPLFNGEPCKIWKINNNLFGSDKLPGQYIEYRIFDIIYDFLKRKGGRAAKGLGRGYRVGTEKCNSNTVMGVIAYEYYNKMDGESTFDPVFVLAAILDWANIANNCRGYIELI